MLMATSTLTQGGPGLEVLSVTMMVVGFRVLLVPLVYLRSYMLRYWLCTMVFDMPGTWALSSYLFYRC